MKKYLFVSVAMFLFATQTVADVTEVSNVKVGFQKFGTFTQKTTSNYKNLLKSDVSDGDFESSGLTGKLMSNFFAKGKTGTIVNLPEKNMYNVNYGNSTYMVSKIEKMNIEAGKPAEQEKEETAENRFK